MVDAVVNKRAKRLKDNIYDTVQDLEVSSVDTAPYYVQVLDYLREIAHALHFVIEPSFKHVDNQHKPLLPEQIKELSLLSEQKSELTQMIITAISSKDFGNFDQITHKQEEVLELIQQLHKSQVKRIKTGDVGTRNSMLYFNILAESKNIVLYMVNLAKSHRDFITEYYKTHKR
jgi:Na+/phosphate symporter